MRHNRGHKRLIIWPEIDLDLVPGLLAFYLNPEKHTRRVGERNGAILTHGDADRHYIYETLTSIVVRR